MDTAKPPVNICWLRRDLRLNDNAALYHALRAKHPVLVVFIYDQNILAKLPDKADARLTFIHHSLAKVNNELKEQGSSLFTAEGYPDVIWKEILDQYNVQAVFANHDYEPYASKRDELIGSLLQEKDIAFYTFKDQVIFEKDEILKANGQPYTVFTPYHKQWLNRLNPFYFKPYPTEKYFDNFSRQPSTPFLSLKSIGFKESDYHFPLQQFAEKLSDYAAQRDFPAADATTRIGLHLRFGTLSIRAVLAKALEKRAYKWIAELAWREFYMMILWHFPYTVNRAFKPAYDNIEWLNDEKQFKAWCEGKTGYPLVDAGMRQLNQTGFMHNRVRMVAASFLCKHLLIDWRWGEAYFAEKLLDYEQASNVGGWQWACGSGNDAAPYFRVFNPQLQLKKFDPKMAYVFKYATEYRQALYPTPIVEHDFARNRALAAYKKALS